MKYLMNKWKTGKVLKSPLVHYVKIKIKKKKRNLQKGASYTVGVV